MTCSSQPLHSVGHLHSPSAYVAGDILETKSNALPSVDPLAHRKWPVFHGTELVLTVAFSCCPYPALHLQTSQTSFRREPGVPRHSVSCQALLRLPSQDAPVIGFARAHTSVSPQASGQRAKSLSSLRYHPCCICLVLSRSPGLRGAGESSTCPRSEQIREIC